MAQGNKQDSTKKQLTLIERFAKPNVRRANCDEENEKKNSFSRPI
jgi:hypothetical protein